MADTWFVDYAASASLPALEEKRRIIQLLIESIVQELQPMEERASA